MSVWGTEEEKRKFAVGALFASEYIGSFGSIYSSGSITGSGALVGSYEYVSSTTKTKCSKYYKQDADGNIYFPRDEVVQWLYEAFTEIQLAYPITIVKDRLFNKISLGDGYLTVANITGSGICIDYQNGIKVYAFVRHTIGNNDLNIRDNVNKVYVSLEVDGQDASQLKNARSLYYSRVAKSHPDGYQVGGYRLELPVEYYDFPFNKYCYIGGKIVTFPFGEKCVVGANMVFYTDYPNMDFYIKDVPRVSNNKFYSSDAKNIPFVGIANDNVDSMVLENTKHLQKMTLKDKYGQSTIEIPVDGAGQVICNPTTNVYMAKIHDLYDYSKYCYVLGYDSYFVVVDKGTM